MKRVVQSALAKDSVAAPAKSRIPVHLKSRHGTALIEAAVLMPMLLLLILNMANLGLYIFACITVSDAAHAAAEYSAYNGVVANFAAQPTFAQIQMLTNNAVSSLPNFANTTVQVCSNANGTATCQGSCPDKACSTPVDPEPTVYTINFVDVEYPFTPVFNAFSIPSLGISLTLPPSIIHRKAAMRSMQ